MNGKPQTTLPQAERGLTGIVHDGNAVERIILSNGNDVTAHVLTLGGSLQSLHAPDAQGNIADVVLGHDSAADYAAHRGFLGVTVGRYANRIADGRFVLDGITHQLEQNEPPHCLHSGSRGFDLRNWQLDEVAADRSAAWVKMSLQSPDNDGGFPGNLKIDLTYRLDRDNRLHIDFTAITDRSTIINMTNHALFNLAGKDAPHAAMLQHLMIAADHFCAVDEQMIPTGELRSVAGSAFDFRQSRCIADGVRDASDDQICIGMGYDHNFALNKGQTDGPELAARLHDPGSGRVLEVFTTEPGLQFYSGNWLAGRVAGKAGRLHRMGDGIALEPQKFPDTPNQPGFGSARLDPGQVYRHAMIYRLSTA
jgi:aldose 1-epimerase